MSTNDNGTRKAQKILLTSETYTEGIGKVRHALHADSVAESFAFFLEKVGMDGKDAVSNADIDPGFGRQIIKGERGTKRDNYIRLAIGMGLSFRDTQSFLARIGVSPLYAIRQRDSAIIFCIQHRFDLMDTQLMLEANKLLPLGDDATLARDKLADPSRISADQAEAILANEDDYEDAAGKIGALEQAEDIAQYFDLLVERAGINRATLLKNARINANTGYLVLRGERVFKYKAPYLRMALALSLSLEETQYMLAFLKAGKLYALHEQDAAVLFCLDRGYSLAETQAFLSAHHLPKL